MAILTTEQLVSQRNECERSGIGINYTKAQVNAALQAVEDRLTSAGTKTALSADIETAAPGVFTAAQKREIVRAVVRRIAERWT